MKFRDAPGVDFLWMTSKLNDLFQNYISENGNNPRALVLALGAWPFLLFRASHENLRWSARRDAAAFDARWVGRSVASSGADAPSIVARRAVEIASSEKRKIFPS